MKPETRFGQVVQLRSSTMKSLSLAALLVGLIGQFGYRVSGTPDIGDQGELAAVPVQYAFPRTNALEIDSEGSTSYGGSGYGEAFRGFQSENTGRLNDAENYGRSDADQYGSMKRNSGRRVVLVLIRRRPRLEDGSGSGEDGDRWGTQGEGYSSDDQYQSQRRRALRALLRILLKKILFAAARQSSAGEGTEEGQGGDFGAEQQSGRREPVWPTEPRFNEGSDSGSTDTFDSRVGRWGRDGLGVADDPLLGRFGMRNAGDSSSLYGSSNDQGPQNGAYWSSGETLSGVPIGLPRMSGEGVGGHYANAGNGATGYGDFSRMRNPGAGRQGSQFGAIPAYGNGGLTDLRGFEGSSKSFSAQPSTWQGSGSTFAQNPNEMVLNNEGGSYVGASRDWQSGNQGINYYASSTPHRVFMRTPSSYTEGGQGGSSGGSYDSRFEGTTVNANSASSNTGYSGLSRFGGLPTGNAPDANEFSGAYISNNAADGNTASLKTQWPQQRS